MALVPVSKEEEAAASLQRLQNWMAKLPQAERARFCEHGRYWGFNGALRFMSPCCSTAS